MTLGEVRRNELARLDDRQRAALVLADSFVTDPRRLEGEVRRAVLEELTAAEIVELLFDVMAWSQQKVLVALELDAPVDPASLTTLAFDDRGHAVVGGSA